MRPSLYRATEIYTGSPLTSCDILPSVPNLICKDLLHSSLPDLRSFLYGATEIYTDNPLTSRDIFPILTTRTLSYVFQTETFLNIGSSSHQLLERSAAEAVAHKFKLHVHVY